MKIGHSGKTTFQVIKKGSVCRFESNLENVTGGFEFGLLLLLLLLHRGAGDALVHAGFGSRLGKVFIQLNLQVVHLSLDAMEPKSITVFFRTISQRISRTMKKCIMKE